MAGGFEDLPMRNMLAVIMAGGSGERLNILSQERAKPAVPFAGKYRIIDFALSNCVNSGLHNIIVLTQYQPVSLTEHIGIGTPWGLAVPDRNIRLLQPYLTRGGDRDWYKGTADAVYQNLNHIAREKCSEVLILSGDHIYKMDFTPMLAFHREKQADATLAVTPMPEKELYRFGTVVMNENGQVTRFREKIKDPPGNLVSMGVYIFNMKTLQRWLEAKEGHDFGRNIFPKMVKKSRIYAYVFKGYWRDIGTVESYWQSNMDLLTIEPSILGDERWPIHTREGEWPPAKFGDNASVANCLISGGCVIDGQVEHSVIAPGVQIARGAVIKDSIIMEKAVIGRHSVVDRCILDKQVTVGSDSFVGSGEDRRPNRLHPEILSSGLTVIGKQAAIPSKFKIGRNCIIYEGVTGNDLPLYRLKSGETIRHKARRAGAKT